MKDAFQALEDNLKIIISLINENDYKSSRRFSTNLITTFTYIDYTDGIFIFEVLESVFDQIDQAVEFFKISDNDKNELHEQILKQLSIILSSYKDKSQLYDSLKEIRSVTTKFQIITCTSSKPNERPPLQSMETMQ